MNILIFACNAYCIAVLIVTVLSVLDWILAIDKLNPVLKKLYRQLDGDETLLILIAMSLSSVVAAFVYMLVGYDLCKMIYILFASVSMLMILLGVGLGLLGVLVYFISEGLTRIRNYMLSKKKQ